MGGQPDGLWGLTRFSDNEGDIIWPAWRAELKQRVAFEFGKIGNQIIEGEVKESDADERVVTVVPWLVRARSPRCILPIRLQGPPPMCFWVGVRSFLLNSFLGPLTTGPEV